ncbi:MAG: hypothetical protein ACOX6S_05010 [Clostridia bacterium]
MRNRLKGLLGLPSRISTNSLLDILNSLYSYEEYKELIDVLEKNPSDDTGAPD